MQASIRSLRSHSSLIRAVLFGVALVACSDESVSNAPDSNAPVSEATSPIIGGQPTTSDAAVVLLVSYPQDHSTLDSCTASLIAPTILLTAAHCVDPATHQGFSFGIFPGPDASAYTTIDTLVPQLLPIQEVHIHPAYDTVPPFDADIGVAILAQPLAVTPLPILRTAPDPALVGQAARIVGYGQAVYGQQSSTKRTATTVLAAIDTGDTVTVGDNVKHGCVGDSGGPALVSINGVDTIVGEDSYTDVTGCVGPAHYRRPDLYLPFLDMYAPPPAPATSASVGASSGAGPSSSAAGPATSAGSGATSGGDTGGASSKDDGGGCSVEVASSGENAPWIAFAALLGIASIKRSALARRKQIR